MAVIRLEPQVIERHYDALAVHGWTHRCRDCDYRRGQLIAAGLPIRDELVSVDEDEPDDDEDDFTVDDRE